MSSLVKTGDPLFSGKVCLVTGASSGLGVEFAKQLAIQGARLVIVARSGEKLQALAPELESLSGHAVTVLPCDLSETNAVFALCEQLKEQGLSVEHLINNAGVGRAHPVSSDQPELLVNLVQLNCTSLTELTTRLLPDMVQRNSGGILQVASMVALSPSPYMSAYAASKAYVKSFTEGLAVELQGSNVRMMALCPGQVPTGFQKAAGFGEGAMSVPGEMSAEQTVRKALLAYRAGKTVYIPGFVNRLGAFFMGFLPRSWVARISASALRKLGRFD